MKRAVTTCIFLVLIGVATLWLPLWVQLVLYGIAIIVMPNRVLLLVVALFSDALYAPGAQLSFAHLKMTILILVVLAAHWIIMHKTRFRSLYGVEA